MTEHKKSRYKVLDTLPLWILTIAYLAHIAEEYFLDWRKWVESVSGYRLSWKDFFIANAIVIAIGISCSIIGFSWPWISYLFVGLAIINALIAHIGTTIVKRKFSPGLITSIVLFLPIGIWAYAKTAEKGVFTASFVAITLFGGFLIMAIPIIIQYIKARKLKQ